MTITIEARIEEGEGVCARLDEYAALYSRLERLLFVAHYVRGEALTEVKRRFISEHRISARQFNALRVQLAGKVDSWRECRKNNLQSTERLLVRCKEQIEKARTPFIAHQKKRRLAMLTARKAYIEEDLAAKVPKICFGSRRLFHAQHALAANGYNNHAEWRQDWSQARSAGFFCLGSSDESAGNQSCQYRPEDEALHLRIPEALGGGMMRIPVSFSYRHADLLAALQPREQQLTQGVRKGQTVERGLAISYRFLRRENGRWYVQASFKTQPVPAISSHLRGCIGVDLNPWGLAVTRIDPSGNPVESWDLPWHLEGRTSKQVKASIGDAVAQVVAIALKYQVPVACEQLDFTTKQGNAPTAKLNKMLSSFATSCFAQLLRGRCARMGTELREVKAAFTSVIGAGKFATGYGLSVHRAAACVIARRALNFGEKLCVRLAGSALALPVRNRSRHVWHDWGRWAKARRPRRKASTKNSRNPIPVQAWGVSPPILTTSLAARDATLTRRTAQVVQAHRLATNSVRVAS